VASSGDSGARTTAVVVVVVDEVVAASVVVVKPTVVAVVVVICPIAASTALQRSAQSPGEMKTNGRPGEFIERSKHNN